MKINRLNASRTIHYPPISQSRLVCQPFAPRLVDSSSFDVVHFPCRTIPDRCSSMSIAIHRVKLPTELLSLSLLLSLFFCRLEFIDLDACKYRNRSSNSDSKTELDGFITERSQRELSINSLGILSTTVASLPVLIRQLVVSWLLARGSALPRTREIIRSPVRKRRSLSSPAKTGGTLDSRADFKRIR